MKAGTALCWCRPSQRGTFTISKWITLREPPKVLHALTKSFISCSVEHLLICSCSVLVCLCASLSLYLPSSLRFFYSLLSSSITHAAGGQGECGVFTGSKIYEQLKVGRRPASISPACCCQDGWGGLTVNHRLYIFISVFPSKREGYDKIMFYCPRISSAM